MEKVIIYIITGASRGLGYALVENILNTELENTIVVGLSRTEQSAFNRYGNKFEWVKTDLKHPGDISIRLDSVLKKYNPNIICFINNAGDINPIAKIGAINGFEMIDSYSVNIQSPVNCVNYLLKNYANNKKLIFINITSGAASKAIKGWSLYCSAKAYMKIYFDVLAAESMDEADGRIVVRQIDPGAMDTAMQAEIRNASVPSEQYDKLKNLYENNNLKQPKDVAMMILQSIREIL